MPRPDRRTCASGVFGIVFAVVSLVGLLPVSLASDQDERPSAEALIRQEQIRSSVAAAFDVFRAPASDGQEYVEKAVVASDMLVEIGPDAVPYVANELEQALPGTYYFCAFTLGRIGDEPSARALRDAIDRAEVESGDFAIYRKAWAALALAAAGVDEALDLMTRGRHLAAHVMMHRETSALESAALQIPPERSVPILLAQLERFRGDEAMIGQRTWVLRALRRVGDVAAVPPIVAILDDPEAFGLRNEAARALGGLPSAATTAALLRRIGDEDFLLRRTVALSLGTLAPKTAIPAILDRLEDEEDTVVRRFFYEVLVTSGDPSDTSWVDASWGRPDPMDRRALIGALEHLGQTRADRLREALRDDDLGVLVDTAAVLLRLGDDASRRALAEAVRRVDNDRLGPLAQVLLPAGGPLIESTFIERLQRDELKAAAAEPAMRESIGRIIESLLARGTLGVSPTLSDWRKTAKDPLLIKRLDRVQPLFELLDRHGRSAGAWIKLIGSEDVAQRRVAVARLAASSSTKAARALVEAFDRDDLEPDERIAIVDALAGIGRATIAAPVLERVLLDDAFDEFSMHPLRDAAAWAARRLGGTAMSDLLSRVIERHQAREIAPLVYLTLLDPARGTAAIDRHRTDRMLNLGRALGDEQIALDRLRREVAEGRSLRRWDREPGRLPIR